MWQAIKKLKSMFNDRCPEEGFFLGGMGVGWSEGSIIIHLAIIKPFFLLFYTSHPILKEPLRQCDVKHDDK